MKKNNKKINKNMMVAFLLNLSFTIIEIIGGLLTNSISILSDAIHDLGDSISIGISLILEKISRKDPDSKYTYGYLRYSVLGAMVNLLVLSIGTIIIIMNCIPRLLNPESVNHDGMLFLAILGLIFNGIGVLRTKKGKSISEKVISLHLLEDVLGWLMVLVVSLAIKFFNLEILDPILSILISIFIIFNIFKNGKNILSIIMEKVPKDISITDIKKELLKNKDVSDVHHVHVWSLDGNSNYFTSHIVLNSNMGAIKLSALKLKIKDQLIHLNIKHSTLEFELKDEVCDDKHCNVEISTEHHHH